MIPHLWHRWSKWSEPRPVACESSVLAHDGSTVLEVKHSTNVQERTCAVCGKVQTREVV